MHTRWSSRLGLYGRRSPRFLHCIALHTMIVVDDVAFAYTRELLDVVGFLRDDDDDDV